MRCHKYFLGQFLRIKPNTVTILNVLFYWIEWKMRIWNWKWIQISFPCESKFQIFSKPSYQIAQRKWKLHKNSHNFYISVENVFDCFNVFNLHWNNQKTFRQRCKNLSIYFFTGKRREIKSLVKLNCILNRKNKGIKCQNKSVQYMLNDAAVLAVELENISQNWI